jgi:hypothetical protein
MLKVFFRIYANYVGLEKLGGIRRIHTHKAGEGALDDMNAITSS